VVKVIQQKGRIIAAHGWFNVSARCFLGPTRVHFPNGISIGSAVFAQLRAALHFTMGRPLFPSKLSLHIGIWTLT